MAVRCNQAIDGFASNVIHLTMVRSRERLFLIAVVGCLKSDVVMTALFVVYPPEVKPF